MKALKTFQSTSKNEEGLSERNKMKPMIINDSGMELPEEALLKWVKDITIELLKKNVLSIDKKGKEVGLVFLNENDAKKLNWNYRCKDYPTDILSFDSEDPDSLGELVLCPQVITRQAAEHGLSREDEFGYTLLHGVLHLLGYDHEKSKENETLMMGIQDDVFEIIRSPKKNIKTIEKTNKKSDRDNVNVEAKGAPKVKPKEKAKANEKLISKTHSKTKAKPIAKSKSKFKPKPKSDKKKRT